MPSEPITIVIADDHAVVRAGSAPTARGRGGPRGRRGGERPRPDHHAAAGVHAGGPGARPAHGTRAQPEHAFELRSASPATRVVILTMDDDPAFVHRPGAPALPATCSRRPRGPSSCARSGRWAKAGATWIRRSADGRWPVPADAVLTERELEVLRLRRARAYQQRDRQTVCTSARVRSRPIAPTCRASSASAGGPSSSATRSSTESSTDERQRHARDQLAVEAAERRVTEHEPRRSTARRRRPRLAASRSSSAAVVAFRGARSQRAWPSTTLMRCSPTST